MERLSEMEKPKGYEKWRVRQLQKEKRRQKREDLEWRMQRHLEKKLRGRERGHTDLPQIITHETAERWGRENRKTRNKIMVCR